MAQNVKTQDGKIVYSAPPDSLGVPQDVLVKVEGTLSATSGLKSNSLLSHTGSALSLAALDSDLLLNSPSGSIILNSITWPTNMPAAGSFIGSVNNNSLSYTPFVIAVIGSDTESNSDLIAAFPLAVPGQQVIGPSVVYQCFAAAPAIDRWRTSGAGGSLSPVDPTEIAYGDISPGSLTSTPNFRYIDNGLEQYIKVGVLGDAIISSEAGSRMLINSDMDLIITSAAGRIILNSQLSVNNTVGTTGQVLTSRGPNLSPTWSVSTAVVVTPINQILYGTGTGSTSSGSLKFLPSTSTLSVAAIETVTITSIPSTTLQLIGDAGVTIDAGTGSLRVNSELSVNNTVGSVGQLLESRGPGLSPTWVTPVPPPSTISAPINELLYGTGTGVTSDATLNYNSSIETLSVGSASTGVISSNVGYDLQITGDTGVVISSSSGTINLNSPMILVNKTKTELLAYSLTLGAVALCTDAPSEGATGPSCPVWYDGTIWRRMSDNIAI